METILSKAATGGVSQKKLLKISLSYRPRDLGPATLLKKRLWHTCFPVNFAKFSRTPVIMERLWWLLLHFSLRKGTLWFMFPLAIDWHIPARKQSLPMNILKMFRSIIRNMLLSQQKQFIKLQAWGFSVTSCFFLRLLRNF